MLRLPLETQLSRGMKKTSRHTCPSVPALGRMSSWHQEEEPPSERRPAEQGLE